VRIAGDDLLKLDRAKGEIWREFQKAFDSSFGDIAIEANKRGSKSWASLGGIQPV
jgi:hypothetical protein